MIASEIRQLEDRLEHEKAIVDRQLLLKRLWKLRQEEGTEKTSAPSADKKVAPSAQKKESSAP